MLRYALKLGKKQDRNGRNIIMKVKITGLVSSPRKHANTWLLVKECLNGARELKDVETELIELADYKYGGGCIRCLKCVTDPGKFCQAYRDDHNKVLQKLLSGDGFIFGSPVYIGSVTAQLKMFIDRCYCIGNQIGNPMRNRPFGVVTIGNARYGGQELTNTDLIHTFMAMDMIPITPMSHPDQKKMVGYYGVAAQCGFPDRDPRVTLCIGPDSFEAVKQDKDALATCFTLGLRVAEMAKVIKAGFQLVNPENGETRWPLHAPANPLIHNNLT
jgi:multimeric flavodoxin WrbA